MKGSLIQEFPSILISEVKGALMNAQHLTQFFSQSFQGGDIGNVKAKGLSAFNHNLPHLALLGMFQNVLVIGPMQWMSLMGHIIFGEVLALTFVWLNSRPK